MRRDRPTLAFWRRLDRPGHDACRLEFTGAAWVLSGHAVFLDDEGPASLAYRVIVGEDWVTRVGRVIGWVGERPVDWTVQRDAGGWRLDGRPAPGLEACRDLDFGFTPATNVLQLQRLDMQVGDSAGVPVAWMDSGSNGLSRLDQTYIRRSATSYDYAAPGVPYAAMLEIGPNGFVALYPELWEAEG
jgi:hypothetical protein